jgi:hypothetical protein
MIFGKAGMMEAIEDRTFGIVEEASQRVMPQARGKIPLWRGTKILGKRV